MRERPVEAQAPQMRASSTWFAAARICLPTAVIIFLICGLSVGLGFVSEYH